MTNADVVRVFSEIADMMEIKGEDSFRVSSYRRVARAVEELAGDIREIAARGGLTEIAGVGKSSAEKIQEFLRTGKVRLHEELSAEVPHSLLGLLRIPGMGPKKAALLWKERGVDSLEKLKSAIDSGALSGLKGFGDKSIEQIRHGLEFLERVAGRTRLGDAWPIAHAFRDAVSKLKGVRRVELAGSLRRGCETIGDLDLLCAAENGEPVVTAFTKLPGVRRVLASGETKGSVLAELAGGQEIQVDLRVVPEDSFGAAWQYFTGNKAHNIRLRELAQKRGWTLNEYALSDEKTGKVIASKSEKDIYDAFGLPCYPPELREDRFEFELRHVPRDLLRIENIRGELHMHTTASDGRNTPEEMVAAARRRGYGYICITDHSQSSVIANGLKPDRLATHIQAVRKAAAKLKDFTLWVGAEVDIHADGTLDYPDELLAKLDFVVASVHFGLGKDSEANTRRTLAAIRNPYVNLIAHPTGRLINERDAMPIDIEAIAKEAAATGTALEINANYYRLDLKDIHARAARDAGAMICINCDAHAGEQFAQMEFGVITARRAGLLKGDVLNTRESEDVREFVQAKRKKRGKRE